MILNVLLNISIKSNIFRSKNLEQKQENHLKQ